MSALEENDMRQTMPRFSADNFSHNLALVDQLAEIARRNDCTSAQLALAWVLARDPDFVPIPGTKHVKFVAENAAAAELEIEPADLQAAGDLFSNGRVLGDRYARSHMISLDPDQ